MRLRSFDRAEGYRDLELCGIRLGLQVGIKTIAAPNAVGPSGNSGVGNLRMSTRRELVLKILVLGITQAVEGAAVRLFALALAQVKETAKNVCEGSSGAQRNAESSLGRTGYGSRRRT
jgi:hypothetical protein